MVGAVQRLAVLLRVEGVEQIWLPTVSGQAEVCNFAQPTKKSDILLSIVSMMAHMYKKALALSS
jgi:hypothetical protein